ncbi:DUF6691 family protein [Xanthomonas maliensis]|uniref:DUF6691 family protein n=1 Tax=Xanthomonas maliensis TaxID=1321368 RepID=UPI00039F067D|nr:DUF6691 family protein [Xanthomonas maliensis]KAB7770111.1 transporter [Xanthomonas maliensis]
MKKQLLGGLIAGALFGLGLALSGMVDPRRVLAFLDVAGAFDPGLLFTLAGAVTTTLALFPLVLRRSRPLAASSFCLPAPAPIDRRLLGGAVLFGIGWGYAGYCPGPALAGLGVGSLEAAWFVPAMLAGTLLHRVLERNWRRG